MLKSVPPLLPRHRVMTNQHREVRRRVYEPKKAEHVFSKQSEFKAALMSV